jgi:2-(3-amino-3-carboxypropyl)histidine synthase
LIHYGHSCLVPIDRTLIKTLYVFVDIKLDLTHFIQTLKLNFEPGTKMALVATIQFVASLQSAVNELSEFDLIIPQSKPLSKGEILGCTAPNFNGREYIIYLGDGRFHLEAIMISNPKLPAFRYDPYSKVFSKESYDHKEMEELRIEAINSGKRAKTFGLIMVNISIYLIGNFR